MYNLNLLGIALVPNMDKIHLFISDSGEAIF